MRYTRWEKPLIITGAILFTVAYGMGAFSLYGMFTNPRFLEANPGFVEFHNSIPNPIGDALKNAGIQLDPQVADPILIALTSVTAIIALAMHVYCDKNPEKDTWSEPGEEDNSYWKKLPPPSIVFAAFAMMFGMMTAFEVATFVGDNTLPQLGDYTALTEQIAIAAGVIGAVGIALVLLGALQGKAEVAERI